MLVSALRTPLAGRSFSTATAATPFAWFKSLSEAAAFLQQNSAPAKQRSLKSKDSFGSADVVRAVHSGQNIKQALNVTDKDAAKTYLSTIPSRLQSAQQLAKASLSPQDYDTAQRQWDKFQADQKAPFENPDEFFASILKGLVPLSEKIKPKFNRAVTESVALFRHVARKPLDWDSTDVWAPRKDKLMDLDAQWERFRQSRADRFLGLPAAEELPSRQLWTEARIKQFQTEYRAKQLQHLEYKNFISERQVTLANSAEAVDNIVVPFIHHCSKLGQVATAAEWLKKLKGTFEQNPSPAIYNRLLLAYFENAQFSEAKGLAKEMYFADVEFDEGMKRVLYCYASVPEADQEILGFLHLNSKQEAAFKALAV